MPLFRRRTRTEGGAVVSDRAASKAELEALRQFVTSRKGVEAYVEPKTVVTQTTMVLVADDGEWIRRRVPSPSTAAQWARKIGVPIYDTNRTGYPQRMRDYTVRQQKAQQARPASPRGASGAATPAVSPAKMRAIVTLETIAGVEPLPVDPDLATLQKVWRQARAHAHPDRREGDRTQWDRVEESARVLGLTD